MRLMAENGGCRGAHPAQGEAESCLAGVTGARGFTSVPKIPRSTFLSEVSLVSLISQYCIY